MSTTYPSPMFSWVTTSGEDVNGPLNFTATGASQKRSALDRWADPYNLKDFDTTGGADYAAALNSAIATIAASGSHGGKLVLPTGRLTVGSGIVASIPAGAKLLIEGQGAGASELYFSNATDGLNFKLLNSGSAWGLVSLHGFSVTRGPSAPVMANTAVNIYADPTANKITMGSMSFRDLFIAGSAPQGNQWLNSMVLNGVSNCSLDNVILLGVNSVATDQGDALLTITGPNSGQYATANSIVNSLMQGGSAGLLVNGYVQGVEVTNCAIIGQYDSVRWTGSTTTLPEELSLTNCSLNGGHRGVYITMLNQSSFVGCTILHFNTGVAGTWAGIEINQGGFNSVLGNNIIGLNSGTECGVIVSAGGTNSNTIQGNLTGNITSYGVWLSGSTANATVVGNNVITSGPIGIQQDTLGNTIVGNTYNGSTMSFTQGGNAAPGSALNVVQNLIYTNNSQIGAPSFGTRSPGSRIVLFPALGTSAADYAIGMAGNNLWLSLPVNAGSNTFGWYGGTTQVATLDGVGNLTLQGYLIAGAAISTGGPSGPNWSSGAAAPSANMPVGSLYSRTTGSVGSTLYVSRGGGTWNPIPGV